MLSTIFNVKPSERRYLAELERAKIEAQTAENIARIQGQNQRSALRTEAEVKDPRGFRYSTDPFDRANAMGEATMTMKKEGAETDRDRMKIAGMMALQQLQESGLYGRQEMAQKHGMKVMNREDFLKSRFVGNFANQYGPSAGAEYDDSGEDIRSVIEEMYGSPGERKKKKSEDIFDWALGGNMGSGGGR